MSPYWGDQRHPHADGRFLLVYHNNDGTLGSHSQWTKVWKTNEANHIRRPTFIALGEFRPQARQPIWFSSPEQTLDTDGVIVGPKKTAEVGTYLSLTEWHGRRTVTILPDAGDRYQSSVLFTNIDA